MVANIQMDDCISAGMFVTNMLTNGTSSAVFQNLTVTDTETEALVNLAEHSLDVETDHAASMMIFPNPSTGQIRIDLSTYLGQNLNLEIINQFGQVLQTRSYLDLNRYFEELDLSAYPAGLYFIRLQDAEGHKQLEKVILQTRP